MGACFLQCRLCFFWYYFGVYTINSVNRHALCRPLYLAFYRTMFGFPDPYRCVCRVVLRVPIRHHRTLFHCSCTQWILFQDTFFLCTATLRERLSGVTPPPNLFHPGLVLCYCWMCIFYNFCAYILIKYILFIHWCIVLYGSLRFVCLTSIGQSEITLQELWLFFYPVS